MSPHRTKSTKHHAIRTIEEDTLSATKSTKHHAMRTSEEDTFSADLKRCHHTEPRALNIMPCARVKKIHFL
ncbi:hypothetical protein J6590_089939, partial [Homalodisca vitripennis]